VIEQVMDWLKTLHRATDTVLALITQDEIDRHELQLIGGVPGSSNAPETGTIRVDKNCLSCLGGQANQLERQKVIQAFKLACLHYNPSKVTIAGLELER